MHVLQLRKREAFATGIHVQLLATAHAGCAGCGNQFLQGHQFRSIRPIGTHQRFESQSLQGVPGQNGGGFIEGDVYGRLATAQCIVVHGRQIVVNQRIGVDHLDGGGGRIESRHIQAEQTAGRIHQTRAQTFAAAEGGVTHGAVQSFRRAGFRRQCVVEHAFDAVLVSRHRFRGTASAVRGWRRCSPC